MFGAHKNVFPVPAVALDGPANIVYLPLCSVCCPSILARKATEQD